MKLWRHFPAYADVDSVEEHHFNTLEELKNIECVKYHLSCDEFYRLSISDETYGTSRALIAERDKGNWWWVVGYITPDAESLGLPKWEYPKHLKNTT